MATPCLDQFTTIPELLQIRYKDNPDQPIYVYAEEGSDEPTTIRYLEFIRACHRAAHLIRPRRSGLNHEVVAIIALVDVVVYSAVIAGLMEAGLIPFPISPRNTPTAVISLLKSSGAHRLLTTQSTLQELLQGIKLELMTPSEPVYHVAFEEIPCLKDLFPMLGKETISDVFEPYSPSTSSPGPDHYAIYLHSSGSTGLPKAIPITDLALFMSWAASGSAKQFHNRNLRIGAMSLPSFHAIGFYIQLIIPLYTGLTIGVYPPIVREGKDKPFTPTPDNVIEHLRRTRCNSCLTIPAIIKIWSQSHATVKFLCSLDVLIYGGGPLPPATGDYLVSRGTRLRALYGGTEFGVPVECNLDEDLEDWAWHRFSKRATLRWIDQGNGTFELQCLNSDTYCVAVNNLLDPTGYATSDLWSPHPTKKDLWSIVGRVDDVIVHSSGEKTIPGAFEEVISKSPLITGVVVFGHQRDQAGVLLEPSYENHINVEDETEVSSFRNKIWPTVDEANKIVPNFSRIYKEMILVSSSTKPLPRAAKGTVLRKAALREYEGEIQRIYEAIESNIGRALVDPPSVWNIATAQQWLATHVKDLCHRALSLSDDIFDHGFDSLCATILRVRIINALQGQAASKLIPQNLVYDHPTITSLAQYIIGLIHNPNQDVASHSHESRIEEMISLYSQDLDIPITSSTQILGEKIVLLTGSTGNLGAQILEDLLSNDLQIACIYTLNRPSSQKSILQRHQERFKDKGLDVNLLLSNKLVHLEGEMSEKMLGLTEDVYNKLRSDLSIIIHNAWRLDFNLSLSSFDKNIRGTRNLIDLARSSSHALSLRFLFTSSIGSAQSWNSDSLGAYPETIILDPQYAVGGGYGESKYVAERILAKSGLHVSSFRIDQITGGKPNGAWAMSDWIPMIIKSSITLGMLPDTKGVVSWTPMDAVSQAILDVALANRQPPIAINLAHPHPVPWTTLIQAIRGSLLSAKHLHPDALPLVQFPQWVHALQEAAVDATPEKLEEVPAAKIIEFLNSMARKSSNTDEHSQSLGGPTLETANIEGISKRMKQLKSIGRQEAEQWVSFWIDHGL